MKNKRGDIPTTILVLGTFVICSLALITFFISNVDFNKSFVGIDLNEKMNSKVNEYNFYSSQGYEDLEIKQKLDEENFYWEDNYFLINQTETKGYWFWSKEEFLFSCKYTLP